jgi:hypothetical protein
VREPPHLRLAVELFQGDGKIFTDRDERFHLPLHQPPRYPLQINRKSLTFPAIIEVSGGYACAIHG